ncbi:hypothetical protein PHYBLDRAFT_168396 [Phycomyces blakesleeanus NRRL 1555(-)]|uniref:Uncharacterized protein n=1 Tax=Phycomyces blakesleeanus (strain ATCC 8743b / DSM 1359 / FGSC 10004 / NBRC 33097 / NRRL 1555) TaxID=763407 RepID=A0A162PU33_PHYB8|nr:hypothetical protein PHYBLDRAFT_168396 [Phycomyces blakesleeanus NRRL 1555(-)]OAD73986.1 hypothetical protein PHYBLDRAFT_168396 [Phycomyces blakesleeanus NRRL 1555(-)]|eukprot:XP_018292026.1 hypothetical protein PHYBLDRAFT_168396 [Phycomyces blakesleeanus NRRL 1555(-)]
MAGLLASKGYIPNWRRGNEGQYTTVKKKCSQDNRFALSNLVRMRQIIFMIRRGFFVVMVEISFASLLRLSRLFLNLTSTTGTKNIALHKLQAMAFEEALEVSIKPLRVN